MSSIGVSSHGVAVAVVILLCAMRLNQMIMFDNSPSHVPHMGRIVVFECPGGSDKGHDGHRADTAPLLSAFREAGFEAESIFYTDENASSLLLELASENSFKQKPVAFVSRVDPGVYPSCTMTKYYDFLRGVAHAGVAAFNHPDEMESLGQKRGLMRLIGMPIFPNDTYLYDAGKGLAGLSQGFSQSLEHSGTRVIKQNRGSKGEGIWLVSVQSEGLKIGNSTSVQIVEASASKTMTMSFGKLLESFASRYLAKAGDAILDMPFLPRIAEGEIRLILSGRRVIHVVEKIPKGSLKQTTECKSPSCAGGEDMAATFSANLDSGARHTWYPPEEYSQVVEPLRANMDELLSRMGVRVPPPLWTADFIRHGPKDDTKFALSEINANCVGFKSFPHLAHQLVSAVAEELQIKPL